MKKPRLVYGIVIATVVCVACFAQDTSTRKASPPAGSQPAAQLRVDATKATRTYANFSRVTGSPEEMIVGFGLNPKPVGTPTEPIVIDQQIIMSYYTAKRLAAALQMSIERHEKVFGRIETDIEKRVINEP